MRIEIRKEGSLTEHPLLLTETGTLTGAYPEREEAP
jgi:hypothetical protein